LQSANCSETQTRTWIDIHLATRLRSAMPTTLISC